MTPHEFEFLWRLEVDGSQAASEIAEVLNRPIHRVYKTDGTAVANQLRRLVREGFVEGDGQPSQIYHLTEKGRAYVAV